MAAKLTESEVKAMIATSARIVNEYGAYLEQEPISLELVDDSELPYPKSKILDAIYLALLTQTNLEMREALVSSALLLANFQSGVGPQRLFPLGVEITSE